MSSLSSPPLLWSQTRTTLSLTICLEQCSPLELSLCSKHLNFLAKTHEKDFGFNIEFYDQVEDMKYIVTERCVKVELKKRDEQVWPRLLKSVEKHHWIKFDFSNFKDHDDDANDEDETKDLNEGSCEPVRRGDFSRTKHIMEQMAKNGDASKCPFAAMLEESKLTN